MGILRNLFSGKRQAVTRMASAPGGSPPAPPGNSDDRIRVFDEFGRELWITKDQWRQNVLPGTLTAQWNNPDELYGVVVGALQDGFRSDVVEATRHLYAIDPDALRGACIWGIVLMQEGHLDDAERVFRDYIAKRGESGAILTNLAKVYSKRNDDAKTEEILWHALEVDPNQDNACAWYEARHRERGGAEAGLAAWRRIAALPRSWRAQLWLARSALRSQQVAEALALYRESLSRAGQPPPAGALMQISGDLGNAGRIAEIVDLVEPRFSPAVHGIAVANNLIKAHVDLGHLDAAHRILESLYGLQRPDWAQTLSFWATEIAKARIALPGGHDGQKLAVKLLELEGPVWLRQTSPTWGLAPTKAESAPVVAFLTASATTEQAPTEVTRQLADPPGRLSRALPLLLAEHVYLETNARALTLIPLVEGTGSFVLSGAPWDPKAAAQQAAKSHPPSTFVVTMHLDASSEVWKVALSLTRVSDGATLDSFTAEFPRAEPGVAIPGLARRLLGSLGKHGPLSSEPALPFYDAPQGAELADYLLRLEQLLTLRCSETEGSADSLFGEREILDGNVQRCAASPTSITCRLVLAETVFAMKKIRPAVVAEFRSKIERLSQRHPLAGPAGQLVQRRLDAAVGT